MSTPAVAVEPAKPRLSFDDWKKRADASAVKNAKKPLLPPDFAQTLASQSSAQFASWVRRKNTIDVAAQVRAVSLLSKLQLFVLIQL